MKSTSNQEDAGVLNECNRQTTSVDIAVSQCETEMAWITSCTSANFEWLLASSLQLSTASLHATSLSICLTSLIDKVFSPSVRNPSHPNILKLISKSCLHQNPLPNSIACIITCFSSLSSPILITYTHNSIHLFINIPSHFSSKVFSSNRRDPYRSAAFPLPRISLTLSAESSLWDPTACNYPTHLPHITAPNLSTFPWTWRIECSHIQVVYIHPISTEVAEDLILSYITIRFHT